MFDVGLSDHFAQSIVVSVEKEQCEQYEIRVTRPITTAGCVMFFNMFGDYCWSFLDDDALDGNVKFGFFHDVLMYCFLKCFPRGVSCL